MSTLTYMDIRERAIVRDKKQRRPIISLDEKHEKRKSKHKLCNEEVSGSFTCSHAKQRQGNVQKSVLHVHSCCYCFFGWGGRGLVRPNEFVGRFRCRRRLALRDIIFCSSKI